MYRGYVFVTVCLCLCVLAGCGSAGSNNPTVSNLDAGSAGGSGSGSTTLTVAPTQARVLLGSTQQFTASVDVTWSVNEVQGGNDVVGTISPTGLYTPPAVIPFNPVVTIGATSTLDGSNTSVNAEIGGSVNRYAYVASASDDSIQVFTADAHTGKLQPISIVSVGGGTAPTALALSPNGDFLFSLDRGSNEVSIYAIDAATGNLANAGRVPVPAGPYAMVFSSKAKAEFAYVSCDAAATVAAFSFDIHTGALTPLDNGSYVAASGRIQSLAISPDGNFVYAVNRDTNQIVALSIAADGGLSPIAGSPFAAQPGLTSIAVNVGNYAGDYQFLYATSSKGIEAYGRDIRSGALTYVSSATQADAGPSPELLHNVSDGFLLAVNPQSGGGFSHAFDYLGLPPGALSAGSSPVSTGTSPVSGGWLWRDQLGPNWVYILNRQSDPSSATGSIGLYQVDQKKGLVGPSATITTDLHYPTGFVVTP